MNQNQSNKENQFSKTYIIPSPYSGLQNIGSTCYMNSILQTLFMTPEFRTGLYQWKFNKQNDVEKDSIPFQLQKLFGRLQVKISDYIDTRDLIKSFQWDLNQQFEQHDIQEFMRVLFDAIEQSLSTNDSNFIQNLYQGINLNYTKCMKCDTESTRQETFFDYTLVLKDKFSRIYNSSIERAIQIAMKPEKLSGSNQYFCERCQSKQDAIRGTRILKSPPLLCLHVNRFAFDYVMMKREKLNDYMSFPFILNMNNYLNGYDQIPNKIPEDQDEQYFLQEDKQQQQMKQRIIQKATTSTSNPFPPLPNQLQNKSIIKSNTTKAATKKIQNSSQSTKSFLEDKRKQLKKQGKSEDIQININVNDGVNLEEQLIDQQTQITIDRIIQIDEEQDIILSRSQSNKSEEQEQSQQQQQQQIEYQQPPSQCVQKQQDQFQQQQSQKEIKIDLQEDRKLYFQYIDQQYVKYSKQLDDLVVQYKQQGENVYQLYSILNHTGGAFGGHYYAFIRSFMDGRWYCFNDGIVTGMDPTEIEWRAFGGQGNNNNAYMLFYRRIDQNQTDVYSKWGGVFEETDLPEQVQNKIKEERKKLEEYNDDGQQYQKLQQRMLTLKIFMKLDVKLIQIMCTDTFQELQDRSFDLFGIKDRINCRLRAYIPHSDLLIDTYTNKSKLTLAQLKIQSYKTFSFEFRVDPQTEWIEYDSSYINLRITAWNIDIKSAEESNLTKVKIQAKKHWNIQELLDNCIKILQLSNNNQYTILKRQQDYGFDIPKVLIDSDQTLEDLQLQDNQLLYIEQYFDKIEDSRWAQQFDLDQHIISIKFNHPDGVIPDNNINNNKNNNNNENSPDEEYRYAVNIDNRLLICDLKQKMCNSLGLNVDEIIIRRGGRAGLEIKDLQVQIDIGHFVKGSSIYLERGCPLNPGEYRSILYYCTNNDNLSEDKSLYNYVEVGEYALSGDKMLSFLKGDLIQFVNGKLNLQLNAKQVWLRERMQDRLTKVYRDRPMKEQGILEKRMIAIQQIPNQQTEWPNTKELLIVVRLWDQNTWELGAIQEIVVQKNQSCYELAQILQKLYQIEIEYIQACRIVTLYKFNRYDLLSEDWHSLSSTEQFIGSQPLQVANDGSLLIIKDIRQQPRDLSKEELIQVGLQNQCKNKAVKYPRVNALDQQILSGGSYRQEASLKITVKKKESSPVKQEQMVEKYINDQK